MDNNQLAIDSLKFKCDQCASCCRNWKGLILISLHEINNIAEKLNLTLEELFKDFIHFEETKYKYNDREIDLTYFGINQINNQCVFLNDNKCIIHEFKPFLCKIYPFWSIIMQDNIKFKEYSRLCKGFNSKNGIYYNTDQILKNLKREQKYLQDLNRIALLINTIDENEILQDLINNIELDMEFDEDAIYLLRKNLIIEKIRILINQNS